VVVVDWMVSDVDIKKKNSLPRIGGSHREYPRFGDLEFVNWFQKKKKKKKKKQKKKQKKEDKKKKK